MTACLNLLEFNISTHRRTCSGGLLCTHGRHTPFTHAACCCRVYGIVLQPWQISARMVHGKMCFYLYYFLPLAQICATCRSEILRLVACLFEEYAFRLGCGGERQRATAFCAKDNI